LQVGVWNWQRSKRGGHFLAFDLAEQFFAALFVQLRHQREFVRTTVGTSDAAPNEASDVDQ